MNRALPTTLASLLLTGAAAAQLPTFGAEGDPLHGGSLGPAVAHPFPFRALSSWGERAMQYETDLAAVADLQADTRVRLSGVPLPGTVGYDVVDLELERFRFVRSDAVLMVDGEPAGTGRDIEDGFSAWVGRVAGEPDSEVYLAFSRTGTRGWVDRAAGRVHFVALGEEPSGAFSALDTLVVHAEDPLLLAADGPGLWSCETQTLGAAAGPQGGDPAEEDEVLLTKPPRVLQATVPLECRMAVETDFQYYSLFGDLQAAQDYAVSLLGAVSLRFLDAARTVVTMSYLGIYTTSNDPWTSEDVGGSSGDLLNEFSNAWHGANYPANSDLAHFMSGANLGGGVATLGSLCSTNSGFAVSGNLHGRLTFPVVPLNVLNWDFMVVAHETGHNFGSPHTHDYCPPIDECYPGACSAGNQCPNGTIMSYCHLCGGQANILDYFHPRAANLMRGRAQASCLALYECAGCGCPCPAVLSSSPAALNFSLTPQVITLTGTNFGGASYLEVDGRLLDKAAGEFTVVNSTTITFTMPLPSTLGQVDVRVGNGQGLGDPGTVDVVEPPAPVLVTPYTGQPGGNAHYRKELLDVTIAAGAADRVWLAISTDLLPTVLPGTVTLDIGNQFKTLLVFPKFPLPPSGRVTIPLDLRPFPTFTEYYLQAAIFDLSSGTLPLSTTNVESVVLIF